MSEMNWPVWMGDIPTWVTAAAVVFAAGSYNLDRARQRTETEREAREQANRLTAWIVTDPDGQKRKYGVVLDNSSGSGFRDVSVTVKMHSALVDKPIRLVMLPPGRYYVEFDSANDAFPWKFATEVPNTVDECLRPIMHSIKYQVRSVTFTDTREQRWVRDASFVLARAEAN
ncbi:hypothetical protein [Leucobacter chromiiresistens]|nr:hypothetical protein [Leucobacter chromiiresistens]